jgi:hypothetical protein
LRVRKLAVVVLLAVLAPLAPGTAEASLVSPASPFVVPLQTAELQRNFVTYRVFATQYNPNTPGSVEVSVPDKCVKFAALGWNMQNCPPAYTRNGDYRVLVTLDNGKSMVLPVKEVGPWNIDDNYWNLPTGPRPRRLFTDLPRGKPEAQAAVQEGYNTQANCKDLSSPPKPYNPPRTAGADQYGRCVLNASAIDISIPAASQLGFSGSSFVTATFLWEPSRNLSKPAVFRSGAWFFRDVLSSGPGQFGFTYGQSGDIPVLGDWNNDGYKTVGFFRPSQGLWYLRNSNTPGPADGVFRYGSPGDIPVVGDWNNDGTDTLGVFRQGVWHLTNHFDSGVAEGSFRYGAPGETPVVGDWNEDGTDTLGVFRPSQGTWHLTNHFDSGVAEGSFRYGNPGDVPVVGDWDGDGTDTLGIVRGGTWYLSNRFEPGIAQFVFAFGAATDTPRAWR